MFRRVAVLAAAALCLAPAAAAATLTPSESALLREMNRVRAGYHLAPLRYDRRLELAARFHSREMLQSGIFQHGAFDSRMSRFSVRGRLAGENLAWGVGEQATAHVIVAEWLASPEHRANLLRPMFRRVGIGALVGAFAGYDGATVVTTDFAG